MKSDCLGFFSKKIAAVVLAVVSLTGAVFAAEKKEVQTVSFLTDSEAKSRTKFEYKFLSPSVSGAELADISDISLECPWEQVYGYPKFNDTRIYSSDGTKTRDGKTEYAAFGYKWNSAQKIKSIPAMYHVAEISFEVTANRSVKLGNLSYGFILSTWSNGASGVEVTVNDGKPVKFSGKERFGVENINLSKVTLSKGDKAVVKIYSAFNNDRRDQNNNGVFFDVKLDIVNEQTIISSSEAVSFLQKYKESGKEVIVTVPMADLSEKIFKSDKFTVLFDEQFQPVGKNAQAKAASGVKFANVHLSLTDKKRRVFEVSAIDDASSDLALEAAAEASSVAKADNGKSSKKSDSGKSSSKSEKAEKSSSSSGNAKASSSSSASSNSKFEQAVFDSTYAARNYAECKNLISSRKTDDVLNRLDSAMLDYLNKDYMAAGRNLFETQQAMQQVSKEMSVADALKASLVSESSMKYRGPVYERILDYSMRAVSAIKMGEIDRAVGVMNDYTGNYKEEISDIILQEKEIAKISEALESSPDIENAKKVFEKLGLDSSKISLSGVPEAGKASYENSAFLNYLGTLVYAANGDKEHARDFSLVLKSLNPGIDVSQDVEVPEKKGRINVITLTDTIGKRMDSNLEMFPVFTIEGVSMFFKLAYPVFTKPVHKIQVKSVTLSDGQSGKISVIEDFDDAVAIDVASKAKGAYYRSLLRNFVKNGSAITGIAASLEGAKKGVEKAGKNALAKKAADMAMAKAREGANVALLAIVDAEKADVRQAVCLPNKASAAGFTVEPGVYSATVEYTNGVKEVIENIKVEEGKVALAVSDCFSGK